MDGRTHGIGDVVWYLGTAQLVDPYGVANARRPSDRSDRSVENRHTDVPGFGAAFELLETAVAAGVVGFDTARKYGGAEAVLGEFARAHELTLPVVTKILDTPTDALTDQQFVEDALKSIADAQRRLAPLTVEAVLFHDPETALRRRNAVRTLVARAQTEFPSLAIGSSVYEERQIAGDAWDGAAPVYQIPGNALDRRLLRRRWSSTQRVMVRSVFLQGLLLNPDIALPPSIAAHAPVLARYHQIVSQYALDPVATAIAAVYREHSSAPMVIGAELTSQVNEIAASVEAAGDVPAAAIAAITALAERVPPELVDPRRW